MITAKEAKKRTAISIKEWEKRHEAVLQCIKEDIIYRADEGIITTHISVRIM